MNKHGPTRARAKPIIGLDLNGVILNNGQLKSEVARSFFNKRISPGIFTSKLVVQERRLLTSEEYRQIQTTIYGNNYFGCQMPLIKGIAKYLPHLANMGKVVVITSNYGDSLRLSLELLKHYELSQYLEVFPVPLGQRKSAVAKDLNLDFYLDDDPDKLEDLVGLVPNLCLFNYQHNNHIDCSSFATRIKSIPHFYKLIKGRVYEDEMSKQDEESCLPNNLLSPIYG